ncbi:RNA-directed DNA polymerase, eukaryota, reverse transcriptase zinc-binding domain protein [Tanacetum coccineum]|uniref:RNA-directed DNA polymerase, eukaryota, reverse transcriptase zinc-binding domain protein n=1 Tax=Tanacetum coccineum TaxID=301880 RepID=A0ABQ5FNK3_9ASTR
MARCCFADNDMHDSNEISANTDEDGDVVCVDGSYKSISPTDKLVVFDGSQSSVTDNYVCSSDVFNNYKPGVLEQTNVVEHGDEDYILPMMHVVNMYETLVIEADSRIHSSFSDMRGDSIGLPLESTGGLFKEFLKRLQRSQLLNVKMMHCGFWRLTGRSDVVVYPTDYKFYSPRRKGKRDRMSNESAGSVIDVDIHMLVRLQNSAGSVVQRGWKYEYDLKPPEIVMENSKLYTDCSLEMNVDEAMKSEVVHDYSDKKIVVKLEELSVDSVSNENMVNNKEVCKKERIIRRALNTISSCQSKLIDIESSDDEDLSVRVRVETIEGETSILTPAGHAYNWNRMDSRNVDHLYNISKLDTLLKYGEAYLDSDMANKIRKVTDFVSKKRIHSFMFWECHTVLPQIQDNSCSKELHIAPVVGDLMAINEYSDVKAEGVADNLMPDVVIKERFDDAEDYKVDGDPYLYFSPDRISLDENGIHYENDAAEDDFSSVKRLKMSQDCRKKLYC